ncbi:MAG: hypothetical protein JWQ03_3075 [Variovorax sp.]|nr:hypothetical protein [Variovorax sp.]
MSAFSRQYDEAERIPGQPIPIRPEVAAPGVYPLEALSPKLEAAARAIVDKVSCPAAIAANSVLAAASLAVQPFINVKLPTGEVVPSSLFIVTVAASGERKSSCDKHALAAVRARERDLRADHAPMLTCFLADQAAYKAAHKRATTGTNKSRDEMRQALQALGPEPVAPPQPLLISDEGTFQGLQKLFAEAMPSLGLFSDEGGQWLGGYAMAEDQRGQTAAGLSKLWDGAPIKRVRGTDAVTFLPGRRLAMHLMIQHRIAKKLFGDPDLKDQGLLSRILIAQPTSNKGERMWRDPDARSDLELEKYGSRIYSLLREPMPMDPESRELQPKELPLSDQARPLFVAFHDAVEAELKTGAAFEDIAGFAAKLPEHAVRIAAVMAYFENRQVTEISPAALSAGIKVAKFYAEEALRVIGVGSADEDSENAAAVIAWIRKNGFAVVGKRYLSTRVIPKALRPAPILSRAIDLLVEHGHLVPIKGGADMQVNGKLVPQREAFTVIDDGTEEAE